jgi:hypothetical protein
MESLSESGPEQKAAWTDWIKSKKKNSPILEIRAFKFNCILIVAI